MTLRQRSCSWLFTGILIACSLSVRAESIAQEPPLPNPLSLEQALELASVAHPEPDLVARQLDKAYAQQAVIDSDNNTQIYLELLPQEVKVTTTGDYTGDSYVSLRFKKKLYDFGYSEVRAAASDADIVRYKYQLSDALLQHRVEVVREFYSVILADLRYTFENEEMSQLYVKYDRLRERHSLGMISEVELLDAKNVYREQMDIRAACDNARRLTRQRLALRLNRPEQLPNDLVMPELPTTPLVVPDFQELYAIAVKQNPGLQSLLQEVKSKELSMQSQRAQFNPDISALIDLNEYERDLTSRSNIRVGLQFSMPIYPGGRDQALQRQAYAEFLASQSRLRQAEFNLREQLLKLVNRLETLKTEQQTAAERVILQDRVLDRQRAIYELEIQASMGNAMAKLTRAQWLEVKTAFDIALTQAQINALIGKPPTAVLVEK